MKIARQILDFGMEIIEDTDTGEVSLQCLCGQMAMYPQRVVLTPDEVQEFREGTFDAHSLAYEICREIPRAKERLVPPFGEDEVVVPDGLRKTPRKP